MKKSIFIGVISTLFAITSISNANAHAGIDTRNGTPKKGVTSTVMLRIGHGCTAPDGVTKVGTHAVSVLIPAALLKSAVSAAQQIPGWNAVVTTTKDNTNTHKEHTKERTASTTHAQHNIYM